EEGRLLGAGADARPADPGPATPGSQERPRGAAEADCGDAFRRAHETVVDVERPQWKKKILRQPRRTHSGRQESQHAVAVDRRPVRPDALLEGRRVDQRP